MSASEGGFDPFFTGEHQRLLEEHNWGLISRIVCRKLSSFRPCREGMNGAAYRSESSCLTDTTNVYG
jgi:hypothetical protein